LILSLAATLDLSRHDATDDDDDNLDMWRVEQACHVTQPTTQNDFTLRASMIHAIQQLSHDFGLHRFTCQLAISYFDRYRIHADATPDAWQMGAAVCILIASKMEDIETLTLAELCKDDEVTMAELKLVETRVLTTLEFTLHVKTPLHWLHWFIQQAVHTIRCDFDAIANTMMQTDATPHAQQSPSVEHPAIVALRQAYLSQAEWFLSVFMFDVATKAIDTFQLYPHSTHFYPSHIAAASMLHATPSTRADMCARIERVTGYDASTLRGCTKYMILGGKYHDARDIINHSPNYYDLAQRRINLRPYTTVHVNHTHLNPGVYHALVLDGQYEPIPSRHNQTLWTNSTNEQKPASANHTATPRRSTFFHAIAPKRKTEWDSDFEEDDDNDDGDDGDTGSPHQQKRNKISNIDG